MALSFKDSMTKAAEASSTTTYEAVSLASTDTTYFAIKEDLPYSSKYPHTEYSNYNDPNISVIDSNKNISLDPSQVNLTQEINSQYVPFKMFRYYDGIDLLDMSIYMYAVTPLNKAVRVTPVNFQYDESYLYFGIVIPGELCATKGSVKFEMRAEGVNQANDQYRLITRSAEFNVMESLSGSSEVVDPEPDTGWITAFLTQVTNEVAKAQTAAQESQTAALQANASAVQAEETVNNAKADLEAAIDDKISVELENYYTATQVDELLKNVDLTEVYEKIDSIDGLADFNVECEGATLTFYNGEEEIKKVTIDTSPSAEWVSSYGKIVDDKISEAVAPITDDIEAYKEKVDADLQGIHNDIDGLPETLQTDYYNKEAVDEKLKDKASATEVSSLKYSLSAVEQQANTNKNNITAISAKVGALEESLENIDQAPQKTYDATYSEDNIYTLWEIEHEGEDDEVRTAKSQFKISGGGGGSASATVLKIEYVTKSPLVVTVNDKAIIKYNFSGQDSSGDEVPEGDYTWKIGSKIIATGTAVNGENTFDATDFISIGTQKLTLSITDDAGSLVTKTWTVQQIDVRIESSFNDKLTYPIGTVSFDYTPYGAISKDIHFKLDGEEIGKVTTTSSGIPMSYSLPSQSHGAHLLETYITAELNNSVVESNHLFKDIIWYDSSSTVPVIGCVSNNLTVKQYDTANIVYSVFDPKTETPTVVLAVDGKEVSTLTLDTNTQTWQYKSSDVGNHTLTITCGVTVKTITVEVEKLDIDVTPVTAGLEFDFNPTGRSNNDANRLWSDEDVTMTVSDNFDWTNGGYQIDSDGDQYFCVKSGTTATINYNLFSDDPKRNGKEFKVIFKTTNVRNRDTSFITCMNNDIGLDMKIESANIYSSNDNLYSPYCEDDIIEFEFNINKNTDIPMVLTYEDGVPNRPMIYTSDASFMQTNPQPITIGSEDCDVHIYRMKAYSSSLSDRDVQSNFIADARNAEEMINRHNRNQIYDENGSLTPEFLAEKCPDLRIIIVDAPWFTNDKSNKVSDTNITWIHKGGDAVLDNWTCTGAKHSGQGTSSNEYGYAGRNLDLIMNGSDALFTLGDGETTSKTITLTRDSVPTNYLNVKVNIASSENENNAQMTNRYNDYNPFKRTAKLKDSKVRDTMQFFNCVVFIRENDPDISTHREFSDCNTHFYAIGNVGDSKKTDSTRVNDNTDPKEHVIEIMDYNVALAEFPTGYTDSEGKKAICPESEWKAGNTAYDYLHADYKYKDGEFKSFGSESYEFRYEMDGITQDQREENIKAWQAAYKFVVTSGDETFISDFEKYFVKESILYFYLFTERYLLVDNRAKNCFIHYGKVWYTTEEASAFKETYGVEIESKYIDDELGSFNEGYRYDLAFAYDFDTNLGIDNTGKLVLTYGKEDCDYYVDGDPTSSYIYRAAESTFFCRVRDLFPTELQAMFVDRENANAWSADGLISQWDNAQSEFPEELWRLDIQRKYLRTYQGISVDNSIAGTANPRFLTEMLNGRKKYQRRMFERNQELYMATKYFGNRATQDQIMMRFNNPVGATIKPDFTLYLTPYSDMYIGVKMGNVSPVNFRAKAGQEYTIPYSLETADITLIYGASFIQEIGDLSKCYVGDNDFSKATRLQSLTIGSDTEGYANTYMTKISLGNNDLLEYLDVRNVTGLDSVIDLSQCSNLLELHAEGSGATGVIFANGGKLQTTYLPAISSLTVKNLNNIETFEVESYENLLSLIVENTPFLNTYEIVNAAPKLNIVRLIGINWDSSYHIENCAVLDRMLTLRGIGNDGYETSVAMLTGSFHTAVMKQKSLEAYVKAWTNLIITYNSLVAQFAVTFQNDNGDVLDVQYVDQGAVPVDPVTRKDNPIDTPTKESSVSEDYTFSGWDSIFVAIFSNMTFTALYTSSPRKYTIQYASMGAVLFEKTDVYGATVLYEGDTPVYTSEEAGYKFHLFDRWDKSGFVDGDKVINAVFDSCQYVTGYFEGKELGDLRPVEIYALTVLEQNKSIGISASTLFSENDKLSFSLGHDFDYDDIESVEIVDKPTVFNGTNYIDTGIQLFDEDRDFVLAIDFEFSATNDTGATLVECFQPNGSNGFKLWYNTSYRCTWSTVSETVASAGNREMLIIRHTKGDNNLKIYVSNMSGDDISYKELARTKATSGTASLVLGASQPEEGSYENHAKGTINWCKLWYMDLGDDACRTLASWTHEELNLALCSFKKYYLSDNASRRCSFTLLATHLLDGASRSLTSTDTNVGGWASATLNTIYLNKRMYNALPIQWKQLVKKVQVISSIGGKSTDISTSDCYIYIPAAIEVSSAFTSDPYISEGSTISYMTTNESRVRSRIGDEASDYWLRSPSVYNSTYYYSVTSNGTVEGYNNPYYQQYGVCPMFSI